MTFFGHEARRGVSRRRQPTRLHESQRQPFRVLHAHAPMLGQQQHTFISGPTAETRRRISRVLSAGLLSSLLRGCDASHSELVRECSLPAMTAWCKRTNLHLSYPKAPPCGRWARAPTRPQRRRTTTRTAVRLLVTFRRPKRLSCSSHRADG